MRTAILDGRLAPGSRINEVRVAAELGFSRGPLREALRALEEEGLVVRRPYRSPVVAEVGSRAIAEIASLRVRLEPFAIELALPWLRSPAGRTALSESLADLTAAARTADVAACIDCHLRIHRMFYERAGHKLLLDSWRSWESQLRVYFALDASTFTSLDDLVKAHERLTALLLDGDLQEISREVADHVERAAVHASKIARDLDD